MKHWLTTIAKGWVIFVALAAASIAQAAPVYDTPVNLSNSTDNDGGQWINNNGDVAWITSGGVAFWKAPSGPAVIVPGSPLYIYGLNDKGDIIWGSQDQVSCYLLLRDGMTGVVTQLNTTSVCSNNSIALNDRGDVVWMERDAGSTTTYDIFYKARGAATKNISNDSTQNDYAWWLYPNGDVTWIHNTSPTTTTVRRYVDATGSVTNLPATVNPTGGYTANDQGDLVWEQSGTGSESHLYLYDRALNAVSKITPDDGLADGAASIHANGDIVWIKSGAFLSNAKLYYRPKSSPTPQVVDTLLGGDFIYRHLLNGDILYYTYDPGIVGPRLTLYKYGTGQKTYIAKDVSASSTSINRNGDIAWSRGSPSPVPGGPTPVDLFVYVAATGVIDRVTNTAEQLSVSSFPVLSDNHIAWSISVPPGRGEILYAKKSTGDTSPPSVPVLNAPTGITNSSITVSWSASTDTGVSGFKEYRLERCAGLVCVTFAQIAAPTVTSYTDLGPLANTSYRYRVRACDVVGNCSAYSNIVSATTTGIADTTPPSVPGNFALTVNSSEQITLSWSASADTGGSGLSYYSLEHCAGSACTAFVVAGNAGSTATSFINSGLKPNTTYRYRIRAVDRASNISGYSAIVSGAAPADTVGPSAPTLNAPRVTSDTSLTISWGPSTDTGGSGLTEFRVERCIGSTCTTFSQITTSSWSAHGELGLTANTTYRYRVRACDGAGNCSAYSNIVSAGTLAVADITPPSVPTMLAPSGITSIQATLNWTASTDNTGGSGLSHYSVRLCTVSPCADLGHYSQWGTPTTTSLTIRNLTAGTTYQFLVQAVDVAGASSAASNVVSVTTLAADITPPSVPTMNAPSGITNSSITLSWTAATDNVSGSGLDFYALERCVGSGCTNFVPFIGIASPATSYTNVGLIVGTTYQYRVRARDKANNYSSYSNVVSATAGVSTGGNTGLRNPAANQSNSGGDGNGFQTNATQGYLDDGVFAVDTDSGNGTSTSCTSGNKDKHRFHNYGFIIPSGVTIKGIEVRLDAKADNTSGAPKMCVELSWDGGSTWTTAKSTAALTTAEATYTLGSATDTWGRTWSTTNLSNANFRMRIINVASDISRDFSLDWAAVRVHY